MRAPGAVLEPDAEGTEALLREQLLGFGPGNGLGLRVPALVPEQPVELGRVVAPEAAPQDESLRRCDRGDRVDLKEAEPADGLEHAVGAAVECLRPDRDAARLCEADGLGFHRVRTLSATRAAAACARGRL